MRRGIVSNINGYVHVEILNVARLQRICWVLLSSPIKAKIIIKVDVSYSKVQLPLIVGSLLTVHWISGEILCIRQVTVTLC
jgi:hypothetical protein